MSEDKSSYTVTGIKKMRKQVKNMLGDGTSPDNEAINKSINDGINQVQNWMKESPVTPNPFLADDETYAEANRKFMDNQDVTEQEPSHPRPLIDDLLDYCAKWQKRLRLMDWDVFIRIVRMRDMTQSGRSAEIEVIPHKCSAYIDFLDGTDWPEKCTPPMNPELSIIHELLHIIMCPVDEKPDTSTGPMEAIIHKLSNVLYDMEYATRSDEDLPYKQVRCD